jgi:hypothetical protein
MNASTTLNLAVSFALWILIYFPSALPFPGISSCPLSQRSPPYSLSMGPVARVVSEV